MTEVQRNPDGDAQPGFQFTADPDSRGWTYYDFGARDSYEEILATITGQRPQPGDVFGETQIRRDKQTGVTFPVITVDPQRVPLPLEELDAETIADVLSRVERVEAGIFAETVALSASLVELVANSVEAIRQAIAFRLFLFVVYGIPDNGAIPSLRAVGERIVPGAPEACRIDVRMDNVRDLSLAPAVPAGAPDQPGHDSHQSAR